MKEGPDGEQQIEASSADAIRSERQAFSLIPHCNVGKVNWDHPPVARRQILQSGAPTGAGPA